MDIKTRLQFLLYGKLFAAFCLIALIAWFVQRLLLVGVESTEEPEVSIVKVTGNEAADIVPLSSAHQSLVEIEGNYRGYARHLLHLMETNQLNTQYAEALLFTRRMQETIEQALELANDLKEARLLQNGAAQAYLHKAAEAYLARVQGWKDETGYRLRLLEEMRNAPRDVAALSSRERHLRDSRAYLPAGEAKTAKGEKSASSGYFAVEQNLLAAYRVLGYAESEVTLYRGGLLHP